MFINYLTPFLHGDGQSAGAAISHHFLTALLVSLIFTLIFIFPFSKWSYCLTMELNFSQIFFYQLNFSSSSYGQSTRSSHYFTHHCISVDANAAASFLPSQPATPYFL